MPMTTPGARGRDGVSVSVHDGRAQRDLEQVDPATGLGQLLVTFAAAVPFRVGDPLTLPDGSQYPVSAVRDRMTLDGSWSQVVTISD